MKKLLLLFFLFFIKNSFSNEIVNIKSYDRDSYIRIMFETEDKPQYFVTEKEDNKIEVKLPNAIIKNNLHKNIDKLNIVEEIFLFNENDGLKFTILLKNGAKLMRYLYTAPANNTPYYRVIVDITKPTSLNVFLENNLYEKNASTIKENDAKPISLDELIVNNVNIENSFSTMDELIKENVKANTLDELLDLNNINEEEITKGFEEQNNEEIDIDDFLKTINFDVKPKKQRKSKELKKYIVVLDAGHGGKDPGAIGLARTREKDVNISFALYIKNELEKTGRIKVFLTRSNDTFVSLSNRVIKSRKWNADLFISIHSDSSTNRRARGLSIYTLSKKASDTRTADLIRKSLTNRFNYWRNKSKYDKMRYQALNESVKFSSNLIKNLKNDRVRMFSSQPLKQANFAVLLAPEYPSLLIELGFISNRQDEYLLKTTSYKKTIAKNIAKSVKEYFKI